MLCVAADGGAAFNPPGPIPRSGSSFLRIRRRSGDEGSSAASCIINLANTCMGTGVLALPAAYKVAGLGAGTAVCVAMAAVNMMSVHLLDAASARLDGAPTFYSLCEAALPRSGAVIDVALVINCFGAAASYLIVAGDSLEMALGGVAELSRAAWTVLALCAVAPLCFLRNMDALRASSLCAVVSLVLIAAMVVAFAALPGAEPCPPPPGADGALGAGSRAVGSTECATCRTSRCGGAVELGSAPPLAVLATVPTFINAFTCQQNVFSILNELERPTPARKLGVTCAALSLPLVLYLLVATAGYLTFGDAISSDLLQSYAADSRMVGAARLLLALVVLSCIPLQCYPSRLSLLSLLSAASDAASHSPACPPTCGRGDDVDDEYVAFEAAPRPWSARPAGDQRHLQGRADSDAGLASLSGSKAGIAAGFKPSPVASDASFGSLSSRDQARNHHVTTTCHLPPRNHPLGRGALVTPSSHHVTPGGRAAGGICLT